MRLFAIDNDNTITAFPTAEQIPEGQEHFASEKELAKLAANWPADPPVQIWNGFAGVAGFGGDLKPVKKFTNRKSAVARIWKAIQGLDGAAPETAAQEAATPAPKAPKGAPKKAKAAKTARPRTPPRRARAAKRPSCWTCYAARVAQPWQRSPKRPTGRTTASGDSSAEHSAGRWASRSSPARTTQVKGATRSGGRPPRTRPPAARLAAFLVLAAVPESMIPQSAASLDAFGAGRF